MTDPNETRDLDHEVCALVGLSLVHLQEAAKHHNAAANLIAEAAKRMDESLGIRRQKPTEEEMKAAMERLKKPTPKLVVPGG